MINHRLHTSPVQAGRDFQKQITQIILAVFLYLAIFISRCYAQPISSVELLNNAKQYDGNTVAYKGEVVGDIMLRGNYAWLSVNDGSNAIGVWINKELIKDILYAGSYKAKGDLVEIMGKFNRSCVEHGGDLDIHAQSITKTSFGSKTSHVVNKRAINFALGLSCILLLVFLLRARYGSQPHR
jgi:hypothetical protein